ncbi:MAG TPA: TIR domain-containing protein [Saprospiraceae bacterium]|nr:TIR domain-containing protein [Saprospiraceae bacterium]
MSTQKIFFSYSRFDSNFALKLAKDLREAGADIWIDQLDIPAGNHWDSAVEGALSSAAFVLVILSPSSTASTNVMDEVSFALESGKKIIPVLLDDCLAPFRLRRLQRIDFTSDYGVGFNQLVQVLNLATNIAPKTDNTKASNLQNADADSAITGANENATWETNLWEETCRINTIAAYKNYLNQSIKGEFKSEARLFLKQLELQQKEDEVEGLLWQKAKTENSKHIYKHYLEEYPQGNFETLALAAIAELEKAEKEELAKIKAAEKLQEQERLAREKQEKEARLKEEKEKEAKEKLAREQKIKEEKEQAAKEKAAQDLIRQQEREKAAKEKQEKELAKKQEKEKAALLKKQADEKFLKENPGKSLPGSDGKKKIYIGAGVLLLILIVFGITKMTGGNPEEAAWNDAVAKNDSTSFAVFKEKYPSGKYFAIAKSKLEVITRARQQTRDSLNALVVVTDPPIEKPTTNVQKSDTTSKVKVTPTTVTPKTKTAPPPKAPQKLVLGQKHHGGIIIVVNPAGGHGLIASVKEVGSLNWETANKVCAAYTTGSFNDWRLPNKVELSMMYLSRQYLGEFIKGQYWTSTEENKNNAWTQNFSNGNQSKSNKSAKLAVRAVQSF